MPLISLCLVDKCSTNRDVDPLLQHTTNSLFLLISSLDLDKWINEPPSDSGEDMVDDASFFLAPSSTSAADFYSSRGHHSPASSRSSKRDEKEDEEELKKVSFCYLLHLLS